MAKKNKERDLSKRQIMLVSPEAIIGLLRQFMPSMRDQLPADTIPMQVYYDHQRACFAIHVCSEEFLPVPEGAKIPYLDEDDEDEE